MLSDKHNNDEYFSKKEEDDWNKETSKFI